MPRNVLRAYLLGLCALVASTSVAALPATGESAGLTASVRIESATPQSTRLVIETPDRPLERVQADFGTVDISRLDGEGLTVREGWPELPVISRMVLIDPVLGAHLVVHSIDSRFESGLTPLYVPPQDGSASLDRPAEPSLEYLSHDGFWPPEAVVTGSPLIMHGYRMLPITLFPVQVNPTTGETRINTSFDFEIASFGVGENPIADPGRPTVPSTFDRIIDNLVVNPPPRRDVPTPDRGAYLVVYKNANGVLNSLQPLLTWRARQGWDVRRIEVANQDVNGIRDLILNAYRNLPVRPEMVVIVGDVDGSFGIGNFNGGTSDHDFSLLEGNDQVPDVHYGRLTAQDLGTLDRIVARTVMYEADPQMQDLDAYRRGAVMASDNYGISMKSLSKWVKREARDRWGVNDTHEWYNSAPYQGQGGAQFATSEFERGIAFFTYRGWIGMEGTSAGVIMNFRANNRIGFATPMTCATGNYGTEANSISEAMLRSPGGAVGAIGFATSNTHTAYNNAFFIGIWHSVFKLGINHFGAMVNYGRYEMFRHYQPFGDGQFLGFVKWGNLMGDPATRVWNGVPRRITAEYTATLPLGGTNVPVSVVWDDNGEPATGVEVCLYKAGDNFQDVRITDASGTAVFTLPNTLTAGGLLVTVTGRNSKPHMGQISIARAPQYVGLSTWALTADDDQDGYANPGEAFSIAVDLINRGSQSVEGGLTITVEADSPWLDVLDGEAGSDGALAPGATTTVDFTFLMNASAPDRIDAPVNLIVRSGETLWRSRFNVQPRSPKIQIDNLRFAGSPLVRGAVRDLDLIISNQGTKAIAPFAVQIWTDTPSVTLTDAEADYNGIDPESATGAAGSAFRIRAHPFAIPGRTVKVTAAIFSESGFADTASATFTLGQPGNTDPIGPDSYGYVCFDSGDTTWEAHPAYDWIEIDPQTNGRRFNGINTSLSDGGNNQDQSRLVALPVPITYYGQEFNRITVSTNGWMAFGDWSELTMSRNRRIKAGGSASAALYPFWDDLTTGRISTYWDEQDSRFIVQWHEMRSLGNGAGPQTFQVLLYTNGDIVFQYKDISNTSQGSTDTPYSTVGIVNLDNTDGIEYTYYNTYPAGAKRLENRMAIKFTPNSNFITGRLAGRITDAATGSPIVGAEVLTTKGFWAMSDADGNYLIDDIIVDDGYSLTASAQGYNDSTWAGEDGRGFTIVEGETFEYNLSLLHPEFTLDVERFAFEMEADSTTETGFELVNTGNGTLGFRSRYALLDPDGAPRRDEPWDPMLIIEASRAVEDNAIQSVVYVGNHWIVAGGNNREETNYFYRFSKEGEYVDRFEQPVNGPYGIRDMDYALGALWCATQTTRIYKVNPDDGSELASYEIPVRNFSPRNIAVDPATGIIYLSAISGTRLIQCFRIDPDTQQLVFVRSYPKLDPRDGEIIMDNGLAWFRDDPDGFNLYLLSNNEPERDTSRADISIYKMNVSNGEIRYLFSPPSGVIPASVQGRCGMSITPKWDNRAYVLAAVLDNAADDLLGVFELAPNSSWIDYTPRTDTLLAGESTPVVITITSADLDTGRYGVQIEFLHNAGAGITFIPVELNVVGQLIRPAVREDDATPLDWSLSQNYPNPFNPSSQIAFSIKEKSDVRLEVFDLQGRLVATPASGVHEAGRYRAVFDGGSLPAGLYVYRLVAGPFTAARKMLLIK